MYFLQRLETLEAELAEAHESNQKLADRLHAESDAVDDHDALQRMVRDLEEQLEAVSHAERVAQQRIGQMEDEIRNLKSLEQVCDVRFCFSGCCCG